MAWRAGFSLSVGSPAVHDELLGNQSTKTSSSASNNTCAYFSQAPRAGGFALRGPLKSVLAFHSFGSSAEAVLGPETYLMIGAQVNESDPTSPRQSVTKSMVSPRLTSSRSTLVFVF